VITLQVKKHIFSTRDVVEVFDDGELIATVHAHPDRIRVISKFAVECNLDSRAPASCEIKLDRKKRTD
jgi:hypothetical protein